MKRRYPLSAKINALNQIDYLEGDLHRAAQQLGIPPKTLEKWRAKEPELRREHEERQWRQLDRLRFDIHAQMLERCGQIVQHMDIDAFKNAPLNQLNAALANMLAHIRLFEQSQQETEGAHETIKRAEFYYDGQVQTAPPWAGASPRQPGPLQSRRLRQALGKNPTRHDRHPPSSLDEQSALLVVNPDIENGRPSMARLEAFYRALEKRSNQRD